jgi:hypothetical protein
MTSNHPVDLVRLEVAPLSVAKQHKPTKEGTCHELTAVKHPPA